jgi:hypothetical protein
MMKRAHPIANAACHKAHFVWAGVTSDYARTPLPAALVRRGRPARSCLIDGEAIICAMDRFTS